MSRGPIIGNEYADQVLWRVEKQIASVKFELKTLEEKRDGLVKSIKAHDERGF